MLATQRSGLGSEDVGVGDIASSHDRIVGRPVPVRFKAQRESWKVE